MGFGGDYTHMWGDTANMTTYVGGVRVTTPYVGGYARYFGHLMAGLATAGGDNRESDSSFATVVGVSLDFGVTRVGIDWVRTGLDFRRLGVPDAGRDHFRLMVGGVLPLCLRGCRNYLEDGGFDVGGKNTPTP